ncbi:hypothetical protein E8E12_007874 [Didymella heteroderae]|uniref:BTB domain-containing protein n=1 Tax=Didymella heteroderae TaxID=1769908 RepID=A0A9P4X138_9PLEO|nr:hypothetical protein E8E12_007874 [Didymella heteroderae]
MVDSIVHYSKIGDGLPCPTVQIIVGNASEHQNDDSAMETIQRVDTKASQTRTFVIHKNLLIAKSVFFAKALSKHGIGSPSSTGSKTATWIEETLESCVCMKMVQIYSLVTYHCFTLSSPAEPSIRIMEAIQALKRTR